MQNNKALLPGIVLVIGIVLLAGWLSTRSFRDFRVASSTPITPAAFPLQSRSTALPNPYPPPEFETPALLYPYPAFPTQPAILPTLAPTITPSLVAVTNLVEIIEPVIHDLPHPIPGGGYSVSFIDAQHGWLVAGPGPFRDARTKQTSLFVTQDGGARWAWLADVGAFDIDFVSQQHGWGRGGQGLLVTGDGGLTWQDFSLPVEWFTDDWKLYTFDFENLERGWIVLSQDTPDSIYSGQYRNHRLFRTKDGGSTWEPVLLPCAGPDNSSTDYWERIVIHLAGQKDAWLVCSGNPLRQWLPDNVRKLYGWLYHSRDDGQTWETVIQVSLWSLYYTRPHGISPSDLPSIAFADEQLGWIGTGYFGLLRTTDGGHTWHDVAMPWFDNLPFWDVHVFSPLHGLVVWSNSFGALLAETQDGGNSWQQIFPPPLPRQMQFFDAYNGVAVGSFPLQYNQFFHTSDGGFTWRPGKPVWRCSPSETGAGDCVAAVGMYAAIQAFYFVTPQTGYVLTQGAPDALYVTHDGGDTWSLLPKLPTPDTYYSVAFIDEQTGFLTQSSGGVLVTRDGGQTFNVVNQGGLSYPYHYEFINASEGVMSGGKQLYWTGDGGTTWSSVLQTGGIHAERIIEVDLQPEGGYLGVERRIYPHRSR